MEEHLPWSEPNAQQRDSNLLRGETRGRWGLWRNQSNLTMSWVFQKKKPDNQSVSVNTSHTQKGLQRFQSVTVIITQIHCGQEIGRQTPASSLCTPAASPGDTTGGGTHLPSTAHRSPQGTGRKRRRAGATSRHLAARLVPTDLLGDKQVSYRSPSRSEGAHTTHLKVTKGKKKKTTKGWTNPDTTSELPMKLLEGCQPTPCEQNVFSWFLW